VIRSLLSDFSFRLVGPEARLAGDGYLHVRRPDGTVATLLQTASCRLEAPIVDFGSRDRELKRLLVPLLAVKRMSRLANAAVLNLAVSEMAEGHAFVNVGVWNGFTMLAAMAGNAEKLCIGVDNFSEFGGPKEQFLERFTSRRSPSHRFFDQDYVDFFAAGLDRPLGVYLYDGEHSFENQYRGLMVADPFYAEDAVIVVDDTNLDRARDATLQFAADSRLNWEVVYDQRTAGARHPTLWNGLMILQAGGGGSGEVVLPVIDSVEDALVSGGGEDGGELASVLALDGEEHAEIAAQGHEVVRVEGKEGLRDALLESRGRFVLIAEEGSRLAPQALARAVKVALDRAGRAAGRAEAAQ